MQLKNLTVFFLPHGANVDFFAILASVLIAVRVNAGSREQSGTVELFVPAGWEDMLDPVWRVVLPLMPAGYTLVFRPSPTPVRRAAPARRAA